MEVGSGFRTPDPSAVVALAERQHGVVAMHQLEQIGYSRWAVQRRVRADQFLPLHRGVYAVGHRRLTIRGHWMAAVLACGPGAVLSHFAAAAMWELQRAPGSRIDITAIGRHQLAGVRCHIARSLGDEDQAVIDAIPATSLNRTILDVCELHSLQRTRSVLEAAQRKDLLDRPGLDAMIARSAGRAVTQLKAALAELGDEAPWTQSDLERRFLELVRSAGLPEPSANVTVAGEVVDFYWPGHKLIAEVDGYEFHKLRRSFNEDRYRDRKLLLAGVRVVRVTHQGMESGAASLIADLRRLLGHGSASGDSGHVH